jgi:hypothetical protein
VLSNVFCESNFETNFETAGIILFLKKDLMPFFPHKKIAKICYFSQRYINILSCVTKFWMRTLGVPDIWHKKFIAQLTNEANKPGPTEERRSRKKILTWLQSPEINSFLQ